VARSVSPSPIRIVAWILSASSRIAAWSTSVARAVVSLWSLERRYHLAWPAIVHFGMVLVLNLDIYLCTPSVGSVLIVGCAVDKILIKQAVRTIWPVCLAPFATLIPVTYVPAIWLGLPHLFE